LEFGEIVVFFREIFEVWRNFCFFEKFLDFGVLVCQIELFFVHNKQLLKKIKNSIIPCIIYQHLSLWKTNDGGMWEIMVMVGEYLFILCAYFRTGNCEL
jgi:hypothetical protein